MFILDYRNAVRQKANSSDFFYSSSKWVIKQQRQLSILTTHLAKELLRTYSAWVVQERLEYMKLRGA